MGNGTVFAAIRQRVMLHPSMLELLPIDNGGRLRSGGIRVSVDLLQQLTSTKVCHGFSPSEYIYAGLSR